MSEELDIENINSSNDADVNDNDDNVGENNNGDNNDNTPTLEDYQRVFEEKKQLEEKNKKLYARLAKLSSNLKGQAVSHSEDVNDKLERLELRTEGFSDEEIDFLRPYGGKKALENPYVKSAIDIMREKAKAESAVVDVDSTKSDIEKKYTADQLKNMPLEELEKILPKA